MIFVAALWLVISKGDKTMTIDGITYEIISEKQIAGFDNRVEFCLRRPRGKRLYYAVRYENGEISGAV